MKNIKIIISFLFLSLASNSCFAQQNAIHEVESFSTDIFKFLNKLNNDIDSFFEKEKAQKLNRYLDYFKSDLKQYLEIRKNLMDYLNKSNYNIHDKEAIRIVSDLKKDLSKLAQRLNDIRPYVSSELSSDAEDLIDRIYQGQQVQRALYLTELEKLLDGQEVDKGILKKNGENIYNQLLTSVQLITIIQDKLKTKFKLK